MVGLARRGREGTIVLVVVLAYGVEKLSGYCISIGSGLGAGTGSLDAR